MPDDHIVHEAYPTFNERDGILQQLTDNTGERIRSCRWYGYDGQVNIAKMPTRLKQLTHICGTITCIVPHVIH